MESGGELQVAMPLHAWPCALPVPGPALSPVRTYLMDRIGDEVGVTTPRLRPKSLSPKSHAHPARGWWWWTHIYRGHEVEEERLRWLSYAIKMMSGPDELSLGSLTWTWVFLGDTKSPGINDALLLACECKQLIVGVEYIACSFTGLLAINRWRAASQVCWRRMLGLKNIQLHRFFASYYPEHVARPCTVSARRHLRPAGVSTANHTGLTSTSRQLTKV
jgi:hypothetical protein